MPDEEHEAIVAVGTTNPAKIKAVEAAFDIVFPEAKTARRVIGLGVESGVSAQPMTDEETRRGAYNRATNAAEAFAAAHGGRRPLYAVGLEGGIHEEDLSISGTSISTSPAGSSSSSQASLFCFAWMAVYHPSSGKVGWAKTGSFPLPRPVTELVKSGMELGHADDQVFGRVDSKKKDGVVGILTKGVIDRSQYYQHALVLALIPFINDAIY